MVQIQREKRGWVLTTEQVLPSPLEETFDFFSRAENLEEITPPWLHFVIRTPLPIDMRVGTLIDYRLRLHGLPIFWRTAITGWNPPYSFVDSQLRGPYRQWIHTHTFEAHPEGTLIRDHVLYDLWGGSIINRLLVQRDLQRIFEFREQTLTKIFSSRQSSIAGATP